jgi:hypothetical protein
MKHLMQEQAGGLDSGATGQRLTCASHPVPIGVVAFGEMKITGRLLYSSIPAGGARSKVGAISLAIANDFSAAWQFSEPIHPHGQQHHGQELHQTIRRIQADAVRQKCD